MPFHSVPPYLHSHTPSYILIRVLLLIASSHGLSLFWRSSAPLRLCSLSLRLSLTKSSRLQKENSFPLVTVSLLFPRLFLCTLVVFLCVTVTWFLWFPQHDSQWSPSSCSVCTCSGGSISCSTRPCPHLTCPGDQSLFTPAGECCPKCASNGGEG